jgi:hypothetical protein
MGIVAAGRALFIHALGTVIPGCRQKLHGNFRQWKSIAGASARAGDVAGRGRAD